MAGEWLTATANTNMFTYEIAPVFILMEHVVLQKMRELIGWSGGDSILAPGGSISNLYAFLAARHKMFPTYKEKGLAAVGGQLVMFTSDQVNSKSTNLIVKVGPSGFPHQSECSWSMWVVMPAVPLFCEIMRFRLRPRNG